jgi:predicted O-methyltransferase YrrM
MAIMGQIVPDLIEGYLASLNRLSDPVLDDIAHTGVREHLPVIDAGVGGFLRVLAAASGATRILEVGTAIGYSTIWLAGALPKGGQLITMEMSEERAQRARENIKRAGFEDRVVVMIGDAQRLIAKVAGPFDLIFQDCDKKLYGPMLDRLVDLLKPGGLLVTDNVLWDGEVVPGYAASPRKNADDTRAIADYNERLSVHPELMTSTVPLRDGLALSLKRSARA